MRIRPIYQAGETPEYLMTAERAILNESNLSYKQAMARALLQSIATNDQWTIVDGEFQRFSRQQNGSPNNRVLVPNATEIGLRMPQSVPIQVGCEAGFFVRGKHEARAIFRAKDADALFDKRKFTKEKMQSLVGRTSLASWRNAYVYTIAEVIFFCAVFNSGTFNTTNRADRVFFPNSLVEFLPQDLDLDTV